MPRCSVLKKTRLTFEKKAREQDSQNLQKQVKENQMKANAEKVVENHQKDID
jgi:hypothetical protein